MHAAPSHPSPEPARPCRLRTRAIALAVFLPLIAGCIADVVFDPIGSDWSVEGSWLLDGAPPTEESCAALGVHFVRVRFFGLSRTADHPRLVFPCAQGGFDTRPERLVASSTWNMALVAIDAEGNAIATAPPRTFEPLDVRGHVELGTVDFVSSE